MKGVNFVSNDKGENTGLLIDLTQLKSKERTESDLNDFLEELDDLIALELSKGETGRPYADVRKEILDRK